MQRQAKYGQWAHGFDMMHRYASTVYVKEETMRKLIGVVVASALAVATLGGVATAKAGRNATLNVVHGIPGRHGGRVRRRCDGDPGLRARHVVTGVKLPAGSHEFKVVAQTGDLRRCGDPGGRTASPEGR